MATDKAIVISTHILEEVEAVCSRAVIIARGRIRADGRPGDLRARAPDHNAVLLTADASDADALRTGVAAIPEVRNIEILERWDDHVRLRIFPEAGKSIASQINELIEAHDMHVRELFVAQGSLDDMFWEITKSGERDAENHA